MTEFEREQRPLRERLAALKPASNLPETTRAVVPASRAIRFASIASRRQNTTAISGTDGGDILKLNGKTGCWRAGAEKYPLPEGYQVMIVDVIEGWRLWDGDRVVDWVGERPDGSLPPRRELGHLDEARWQKKFGKSADPWERTTVARAIGLSPPFEGHEFRIVCTSISARISMADLVAKMAAREEIEPGSCPVVALGAVKRDGPSGDYHAPALPIADWRKLEEAGPDAEPAEPTPQR